MDRNDLISRSALKEEVNKKQVVGRFNVLNLIDNAPTVEERPQGEWIEKVERRGCFAGDKTVYSYTCPFCGVTEFKKYPFCHCGADMRQNNEPDRQITIEEYMQSLKGEN